MNKYEITFFEYGAANKIIESGNDPVEVIQKTGRMYGTVIKVELIGTVAPAEDRTECLN